MAGEAEFPATKIGTGWMVGRRRPADVGSPAPGGAVFNADRRFGGSTRSWSDPFKRDFSPE